MMGLLEALMSIIIPILVLVFLVALVYAWCGRTQGIKEGVNKVLDEISILLTRQNDEIQPFQYYDIEEKEFTGFKNRVSEYFVYFVFICARNFGNYLMAEYRVSDMQICEEVIEQEWVNFLKDTFNLPIYIKIPVLVVYDKNAGILYLYYAWNENGINTLEEIRKNVTSRKIPQLSNDIIL